MKRLPWPLLGAFAAGAALRLLGLAWGLPLVFNADEPHVINMAVSFGAGTLRPYSFKYPTLWPTLLFAAYGLYFAAWSGLGLRYRVSEFAGLYAWKPAGFYLIARFLAAACTLLGAYAIWSAERRLRPGARPWATLLLLFAPALVEIGQAAKGDSLMFCLCCVGWAAAWGLAAGGGRRAHWLCGAAFGLALGAQYTAAPALLALPLAHLCGPARPRRWLLEGLGCAALGFLAAVPYAVIEPARFIAGLRDVGAFIALRERREIVLATLANLAGFAGTGSIAGLAAAAGALRLARRERSVALTLAIPALAQAALVAASPHGTLIRYLLPAFPALALLSAEGLRWAESPRRPLMTALLALAALAPGAAVALRHDLGLLRPDTRTLSTAWARANLPAGSRVLTDQWHASPDLPMMREQALELTRRNRELGSSRWRYYQALADHHPGGGYWVYRIKRGARDLGSSPEHVRQQQEETPTVDVRPGLDAARALRIDYVITSSYGATPERLPELSPFFDQLSRRGRLLQSFEPQPGRIEGPALRVYALKR